MVRLSERFRPLFPYLKPLYTAATRTASPAVRGYSRLRGGWVPTGVAWDLRDAAADHGEFHLARPAGVERRTAPYGRPLGHPTYAEAEEEVIPEVGLAELRGGRVMSPHALVVTGRGRLVQDLCWYFGTSKAKPYAHPVFLHPSPPAPTDLDGRVGVLASRGDVNYYHFLHDCLPRLAVLDQAGVAPPERWYVPQQTGFQRELLDLLGIPAEARVDSGELPHVRAEVLVAPGLASDVVRNPAWVQAWLRERLCPPELRRVPGRRLYLTRGTARNNRVVLNEDAVLDRLGRLGFQPLDPGTLPVAEQVRAFAEADVIVAPHGASLANLPFCSPGATLLELFPAGTAVADYWKMASGVAGLEYQYLCAPGPVRHAERFSFLVTDITVDLDDLQEMVEAILERHAAVDGPS